MKGWAQLRGGRIKDASATINRAVELAISEDDRLGAFWCFFSRASLHLEQGNRDEAMADFRATLQAFDESLGLDPALQVEEALTIAITNWHLGNHEQAREHYANAVELIERWPIDRNQIPSAVARRSERSAGDVVDGGRKKRERQMTRSQTRLGRWANLKGTNGKISRAG